MSNRRKSTPPRPPADSLPLDEGRHALREIYRHLLDDDTAADVAAIADRVLALALAAEATDTYDPFSMLAAVVADLKFCGGYLRQIARGEREAQLEPEEVAACRQAGELAPRVLLLASQARTWVERAPRPAPRSAP